MRDVSVRPRPRLPALRPRSGGSEAQPWSLEDAQPTLADLLERVREALLVGAHQVVGHPHAVAEHDRPAEGVQELGDGAAQVALLGLRRLLAQVTGEVALDRAPNPVAVLVAERLEGRVDLLGEQRRRQRVGLAEDRVASPAQDATRTADEDEPGAGQRPGRLDGVAPELALDVDRGARRRPRAGRTRRPAERAPPGPRRAPLGLRRERILVLRPLDRLLGGVDGHLRPEPGLDLLGVDPVRGERCPQDAPCRRRTPSRTRAPRRRASRSPQPGRRPGSPPATRPPNRPTTAPPNPVARAPTISPMTAPMTPTLSDGDRERAKDRVDGEVRGLAEPGEQLVRQARPEEDEPDDAGDRRRRSQRAGTPSRRSPTTTAVIATQSSNSEPRSTPQPMLPNSHSPRNSMRTIGRNTPSSSSAASAMPANAAA